MNLATYFSRGVSGFNAYKDVPKLSTRLMSLSLKTYQIVNTFSITHFVAAIAALRVGLEGRK